MSVEISVVLPCLNEAESIEICLEKIRKVFETEKINGEIIVVDNGSTDGSVEIVKKYNDVKLLMEPQRGYGAALRKGIENANGKYILMGDADDSYDFLEIPKFLKMIKEGYDLVIGSRFKGNMLPGAMRWSHRYIGNPILTNMLKLFFGGNISDAHSGLRIFTKEAYEKMNLRTVGMEFASEMVIHALKKKLRITEIPITYYPRKGKSKLSSFRDAWRHVRFMLLYSPNYLFFLPGSILFLIGFIISLWISIFGSIYLFGRHWGIHVMFFSSVLAIAGWHILNTWFSAKVYALNIGLEESNWMKKLLKIFTLERALVIAFIILGFGLLGLLYILYRWAQSGFGPLEELRLGVLSVTLVAMSIQTIFASFLVQVLQVKYK